MISTNEILETIKMIENENLDIRTITMGISLRDCAAESPSAACDKIYNKIMGYAKNLVKTGNDIEKEYGIPIINKRISVTPIAMVAESSNTDNYTMFAEVLDRAAKNLGVNFIGGFSALVEKGYSKGDRILLNSIAESMEKTQFVCSSVNIASTRAGINMDAVYDMGKIIKQTALRTENGIGCAKLVVFANAVYDNPFMAGAFHGISEGECVINVGVSGPGVIKSALAKVKGENFSKVAETIKKTAFKITRMGQMVAEQAAKRLSASFGIVDLSLAPTPTRGDSVAEILEELGLEKTGTHGSTAALAMLNDAVKKGGLMASSHVGGLSGAFIPVSEDLAMIEAAKCGAISIDKLEAMTAVCSVGLDMIAIPGDTDENTISAIIADEAAIGIFNNKTTAVRIIPAPGKKEGDMVEFHGLLGMAPVMKVNKYSSKGFIQRKGRIPAPLQALRN